MRFKIDTHASQQFNEISVDFDSSSEAEESDSSEGDSSVSDDDSESYEKSSFLANPLA